MTFGERASSHASAIWAGVAACSEAMCASAELGWAAKSLAGGPHGKKTMPSFVQASMAASLSRWKRS